MRFSAKSPPAELTTKLAVERDLIASGPVVADTDDLSG